MQDARAPAYPYFPVRRIWAFARLDATRQSALQPRGQFWIGLQVGHRAQPDALIAPIGVAVIDRVPLPILGRQLSLGGARPCHPAQRGHEKKGGCRTSVSTIMRGTSSEPRARESTPWRLPGSVQDVPFSLPVAGETRFWLALKDPHNLARTIQFIFSRLQAAKGGTLSVGDGGRIRALLRSGRQLRFARIRAHLARTALIDPAGMTLGRFKLC